jgi:conjugative transfer region protein (TIGR03748 family)
MTSSHCNASYRGASSGLASTLLVMAWMLTGGAASAQPGADLRLSRYTTGSSIPDAAQVDPLEAVVLVSMPRASVSTVGDAVNYLLLRTGYRLAAPREANEPAGAILAMPLPEVHRQLGPYTVRTALSVLLGAPFALTVDPAQRLVAYGASSSAVADTSASVAEALGAVKPGAGRKGTGR